MLFEAWAGEPCQMVDMALFERDVNRLKAFFASKRRPEVDYLIIGTGTRMRGIFPFIPP